ncbi:MAG: glycosyltransferase [Verrucomicrobiota bacterium]
MLKILQVVDSLDAGGMEAQLVSLMNRLDPEAFRFHVVCLRHEGVHATRLREGIRVTALKKAEGFQWSVVKQIQALLSEGAYDLVHTHNWGPLVYAALATHGGQSVPILHGEHAQLNASERGWKKLWLRKLLYRACAGVHTVSAGQKEELLALGLKHHRLLALINGVDTERFRPTPHEEARLKTQLPAGARILGIVARFGSFKRHAALVEAFENVAASHADLHLLMVGEGGPEKEAVMKQVAASAFSSRIIMAGYQTDPVPWYQSMDALIVPSSNEGLSNATLEAMASGVPVLTNDICGARELLGADEGGWIRDLGSVERLSTELQTLLTMPLDRWQEQGKRGRARAESVFSWDGMARAYAQAFSDCAKARR